MTVGLLSFSQTNPGPSGRSLIGTSNDRGMFKNFMLSLNSFNASDPSILDANGIPTSSPASTVFGQVFFASNLAQSETLVLKGTGVCDVNGIQLARGAPGFTSVVASGGAVIVGGTGFNLQVKCATNVDWEVQFQFATTVASQVTFNFLAGTTFNGTLRNIVFCRLTDKAALAAATTPEQQWDDNYVNVYKALNPRTIRPMGWTNPNSGNVSQSRYIANWQTSINAQSVRWDPGAWAGSTTGTNAYICSSQPDATGSYVDGEMIQLKFINASTSTPITINSGTRGVVPLLRGTTGNAGLALSSGDIGANTLATLTYDSVLGGFLFQTDGQTSCLPYELQIAFANRINANYWCNFQGYFDNASVTAIAMLVRTNLNSALKAYFEYGNEIWNFGFPATPWANVKGQALGFPNNNNRPVYGWYGLRARLVMALVTTAWSPRSAAQLKRCMVFQGFGPSASTNTYRYQGADLAPSGTHTGTGNAAYNTYTGSADYTQSPNRPIDFSDVLSYATYYSGAQCTNFDANYVANGAAAIAGLLAAADNYATGIPANITSALAFLDNDIRAGTLSGSGNPGGQTLLALLSGANSGVGIYPTWNALAVTYNLPLECYEGAHESWYPSTATCTTLGISTGYGGSAGTISILIDAYKKTVAFQQLVADQFTQFMASSKSVTPAWLLLSGINQWGAMQGADVFTATYNSWNAQVTFNN
jgi:hypothetical protein